VSFLALVLLVILQMKAIRVLLKKLSRRMIIGLPLAALGEEEEGEVEEVE
jgi:hypothetical protein